MCFPHLVKRYRKLNGPNSNPTVQASELASTSVADENTTPNITPINDDVVYDEVLDVGAKRVTEIKLKPNSAYDNTSVQNK